jgi:hypothetical protein
MGSEGDFAVAVAVAVAVIAGLTRNPMRSTIAPLKKGQSDGHRRGFAVAVVVVLFVTANSDFIPSPQSHPLPSRHSRHNPLLDIPPNIVYKSIPTK